jgi:hypothetical protein
MEDVRFTAATDDRTFVLMTKNQSTKMIDALIFECSSNVVNHLGAEISKAVSDTVRGS